MRVSINIADYSWPQGPADALRQVVRAADESGVDTVWLPDHLYQADPNLKPDEEMLEAYTTLGYLAGQTERVRLGTMVSGVLHREPALLVKAVTTLDVLSNGRAWLGIGAGYNEEEARRMGLPFPSTRERFDRLEETLELARRMWAGDASPFEGRRYRLEYPVNVPNSVRRPHPPVLVGGMGEKRTLPLVARYGAACNLFDIPDGGQTVRRKLSVLAELCEQGGRDPGDIEKTLSVRVGGEDTPGAFTERCATLAGYGIDHVVVLSAGGPWTPDAVRTFVEAALDAGTREQ